MSEPTVTDAEKPLNIEEKEQLASLFKLIAKDHSVVELHFGNDEEYVSTRAHHFAEEKKALILSPSETLNRIQNHYLPEGLTKIQGLCRGVQFQIEKPLISLDHDQSMVLLALPKCMQYLQRRLCFRVPLSEQGCLSAGDLKEPLQGVLTDISFEGARIVVEDIEKNPFPDSPALVQLTINTAPVGQLTLVTKIRNIYFDDELSKLCLGLEFNALQGKQRTALKQLVLEQQRAELRQAAMMQGD